MIYTGMLQMKNQIRKIQHLIIANDYGLSFLLRDNIMNTKFELSGSKVSVALLLMSALVSTSAMASLVTQASVDCGLREQDATTTGGAFCNYSDTRSSIGGSPAFDYNITATAATGYVLGGLRTSGDIIFDGLIRGNVGAYGIYPAGTFALVQYIDSFLFSFSNVASGEALTMKTTTRFHGNNYENVDESLFYDGNRASMITEYSTSGFGVPSVNQMASFLTIADGLVTPLGSSDVTNIFTKSLTVDVNSAYRTSITQTLSTTLQFSNSFLGSVGVGSGNFGADFSSTAGVLSIEFFDSQNRLVDYQLTTDTGLFSFLRAAPPVSVPVPAPGAISIMLLGLCAVVGFKRRRLTVSATAKTLER